MSHRIGQSKTPLKFCKIFGGAHFYFVSLSLSFGVVLALAYLFSSATPGSLYDRAIFFLFPSIAEVCGRHNA